ncbi:MAG: LolA family protein [Myxococcales bacterium]|jgi:outer membrane lipoprotein-sorting protein
MRPILPLVLFLAFVGCKKREPNEPEELLSRLKAGLAAREKKVVSFQYEGTTVQGEERAEFAFAFRAPKKMRAELTSSGLTFIFDGRQFTQWDSGSKLLQRIDLEKASPEAAALFLHQYLSPFVPEGWRTPLLGGKLGAGVTAEGKVQVSAVTGEGSEAIEVTYLFALPGFDFVGKTVREGGSVQVGRTHCEEALGLCFPILVVETAAGAPAARTELRNVVVNGPLAPEVFELEPPPGARVETRVLR